jgi:hypothetical protein
MPRGPKGDKRPANVIGNAAKVLQIVVGEDDDIAPDEGKHKAAQRLGNWAARRWQRD